MPDTYHTAEQVERYLAPLFPVGTRLNLYRSEYGWVLLPKLPGRDPKPLDRNHPQQGKPTFVVNALTGVVTLHASLPLRTIGQMYDQAIRDQRPVLGHQIYPYRWRASVQRIREDESTIEYRVTAESLSVPTEPAEEPLLIITKHPFDLRTDSPEGAFPESCSRAASWVTMRNRADQTWPEHGTFDY